MSLIPCDRHRPEDLRLWREYAAADLEHGRSRRVAKLVDQSRAAIEAFLSGGPAYASTSHGKDSVVLCHLLYEFDIDVWHLRADSRNPYCDAVRDAFLDRFPLRYHEKPISYAHLPRTLTEDEWDRATDRIWFGAFREIERAYAGRHLSGVRGDESGRRKLRMKRWGISTDKTCAPLVYWTVPDVFGYLALHDLPVHPNYAMLGGGRWQRDKLRVAEIGDTHGSQRGRREWELEYYGDVLRRLEATGR